MPSVVLPSSTSLMLGGEMMVTLFVDDVKPKEVELCWHELACPRFSLYRLTVMSQMNLVVVQQLKSS